MRDRECKGRILVADDEQVVREILIRFFKDKGYVVREAANGRQALAKLEEEKPDVLLLDLKMPDIDGEDVLRHIKEKDIDVGVIIITGNPGYIKDQKLLTSAYDYIEKPFDLDYLNTTVLTKVMLLT
ncbi:MAG: response regulator [Candidatus Omnitrophica bacterium]|nr:response regulator [Candidatus Omnitrophota bacterium]